MDTGRALAALDASIISRMALNAVIELETGDISEAQRNATNARDEFDRVQNSFMLIGSKIDDFQA